MTILHNRVASDILAATGKAGMQPAAGDRFWDWRRIVLVVGYCLVFVAGLLVLVPPTRPVSSSWLPAWLGSYFSTAPGSGSPYGPMSC
jgi:hypothetical protein